MGKIVIEYEKHNETVWQRWWGLFLFPLILFWLLCRDDGMAGWLEVGGHTYKLKYRKKEHPQVIEVPEGECEIVYRKKSKAALLFHAWTRQGNEGFASVMDRMGAFDEYKLENCVVDFGPETVLTLSTRGGRLLRQCQVVSLTGVPQREPAPTATAPHGRKGGVGKTISIIVAALLVVGLVVLLIGNTLTSGRGDVGYPTGDETPVGGTAQGSTTITTTAAATTTTTQAVPRGEDMYVVAKGGLRLREGPNTDSAVLLTIPDRSRVTVLEMPNDWAYVYFDNQYGWCSSDYLFKTLEEATTTTTTTTVANDDTFIIQQGVLEANFHIMYYEGKTVNGAVTTDTLTEDEVMALFQKAYTAYERALWGNVTSNFIPLEGKPVYRAPGGTFLYDSMSDEWRAGTDPQFADFEELCQYYFSCLSDNIASSCLVNRVALIDHCMYYTNYFGIGDEGVKHTISYEVITTDTGYAVVATAQYFRDYDNPDMVTETLTFTFPCEKEDGAWVFTHMEDIPT